MSYGVCCNYDSRIPDLQPRYTSSQKLNYTIQTGSNTLVMDVSSTRKSALELTGQNLGRLQRFKIRTAMSLGPPELRNIYEDEVYELTLKVRMITYFLGYRLLTSICPSILF